MIQYFHAVLPWTITAKTPFAAYDLVGFDDAKVTTDDAPVKAIALNPATEVGLHVSGMLIGIGRLKANGPILKGQKVISAAGGGVKAASANSVNPFAEALTDAADGEFVEILKH